MEETGCEINCGAPTTLAVKEWMKVKAKKSFLYLLDCELEEIWMSEQLSEFYTFNVTLTFASEGVKVIVNNAGNWFLTHGQPRQRNTFDQNQH